jgi:hypothetical protein
MGHFLRPMFENSRWRWQPDMVTLIFPNLAANFSCFPALMSNFLQTENSYLHPRRTQLFGSGTIIHHDAWKPTLGMSIRPTAYFLVSVSQTGSILLAEVRIIKFTSGIYKPGRFFKGSKATKIACWLLRWVPATNHPLCPLSFDRLTQLKI